MGAIPDQRPLVSKPEDNKKIRLDGTSLPPSDGYLEIDDPSLSSSENDLQISDSFSSFAAVESDKDKSKPDEQPLSSLKNDVEIDIALSNLLKAYSKAQLLPPEEKESVWQTLFQVGKKLTDMTDDVWSTLRGAISQNTIDLVSPILVGITGFILLAVEGCLGGRDAYQAYKNEKIGQRKTRIASGATIFMLGGGGVGLSVAYLASAAGGVVLGSAFFPVVITAVLVGIYGLALWKRAYVFSCAKEDEAKAKQEYENSANTVKKLKESIVFKKHYKLSVTNISNLLFSTGLNGTTAVKLQAEINLLEEQLGHLQVEMLGKEQAYLQAQTARLNAERELAFSIMEVFASTLVLVGTILTATAIFSAVFIASFGAVPLAILIAGVATGFLSKVFEHCDEKKNYAYTQRLRNWFAKQWGKLANKKPTVAPIIDPTLVTAPRKEIARVKESPANVISQSSGLCLFGSSAVKNDNQWPAARHSEQEISDGSDEESTPLLKNH
jgi:hypothetical protein